jgi:hypothetical protein
MKDLNAGLAGSIYLLLEMMKVIALLGCVTTVRIRKPRSITMGGMIVVVCVGVLML